MRCIFSFLFRRLTLLRSAAIVVTSVGALATPAFATTKGLSQIVTPDLQEEGDLSQSVLDILQRKKAQLFSESGGCEVRGRFWV